MDDSNLVTDMIAVICSHINIPNSEEYGLRGPDQADHEWLNPQQTLREQGIVDSDVIILRKRFFYSDANVDTTDPYALNLLYQECREAIIMGRYPCNENEATQFAALQCQVTLGNNNPQRHKPGYLSLSEYVPEEYRRAGKKLEKKVYVEHRKLLNMTEVNAKYRYVQLCRSLTTYGVTFFHVEEQLVDARGKKKKGKVVARLLGITRDKVGGFCVRVLCFACVVCMFCLCCVYVLRVERVLPFALLRTTPCFCSPPTPIIENNEMQIVRMDTMTKEVLQSFPLTHLRRWAASGNSFTFDFGDYHEAYYTVQTPDGEQISQVISGYIDIILKRQRDAAAYVADSDDEQVVEEEDLSSMRAQAITSSRGGMGKASEMALSRAGLVTAQGLQSGMSRGQAVYGNVGEGGPGGAASKWKGEFSRGQAGELESFTPANSDVLRAAGLGGLLNDLEGAFNAVNAACNQLAVPISRAPMSDDPAAERWRKQELQGARQQLRVQCNGMTVATAQIVSSTVCNDADDFNPDMLADACKALGGHITQLATLGRQVCFFLGGGVSLCDRKTRGNLAWIAPTASPSPFLPLQITRNNRPPPSPTRWTRTNCSTPARRWVARPSASLVPPTRRPAVWPRASSTPRSATRFSTTPSRLVPRSRACSKRLAPATSTPTTRTSSLRPPTRLPPRPPRWSARPSRPPTRSRARPTRR